MCFCLLTSTLVMHSVNKTEIILAHVATESPLLMMCTYKRPLILDLTDFQRHNVLPKANNVK